jgi:hypothetical protein
VIAGGWRLSSERLVAAFFVQDFQMRLCVQLQQYWPSRIGSSGQVKLLEIHNDCRIGLHLRQLHCMGWRNPCGGFWLGQMGKKRGCLEEIADCGLGECFS